MTIKIYIAGPITGIEYGNRKAFQEAEGFLSGLGLSVVNPLKNGLGNNAPWVEHMKADIQNMLKCDAVYALKGWHNSKGARAEVQLAEVLDMPIFEQCEKDNIKLALFKTKPTNPVFSHTPQSFVTKRDGETGTQSPQYLAAMMQKSSTVDGSRGEARHIPPVFPHQKFINAYAVEASQKPEVFPWFNMISIETGCNESPRDRAIKKNAKAMYTILAELGACGLHFEPITKSVVLKRIDKIIKEVEGL